MITAPTNWRDIDNWLATVRAAATEAASHQNTTFPPDIHARFTARFVDGYVEQTLKSALGTALSANARLTEELAQVDTF